MSTIVPPSTHAQNESDLGHAYVYAEARIEAELTERLDVFGAGLVVGVGDLSGTGSDTLRITRYTGIGASESFQPMGSETEEMESTGFSTGNDTVTIARYGLAKEQGYQDAMLQTAAAREIFALERMVAMVPDSWMSTIRGLWATQLSTFTDVIGDAGVPWTFDAELELVAYFREIEGYDPALHGMPVSGRQPRQLTHLRNSLRNEPGLQGSAELIQRLVGLGDLPGGGLEFLGMRNIGSWDIASSGGDYIGGAYIPGAVAYCVASTLPAPVQDPTRTVFVPQMGLVIESRSRMESAVAKFAANGWVGFTNRSQLLYPQVRLRSTTAP